VGSPRRVEVGVFERPHGLRGEIAFRRPGGAALPHHRILVDGKPLRVVGQRAKGDRLLLTLEGVETREAAAMLTGRVAEVPREELPPLPDGEVYLCDLPGITLAHADGTRAGVVRDVLDLGGQTYLELDGGGLVPFRPELVEAIDAEGGVLRMRLPDGILDL
jgi:16S rRNA processing protein RimM